MAVKKVKSMHDFFGNPRYRGKHVILAGGRVFTARTGDGVSDILKMIREKYPKITPEIAYIPKKQILTL